MFWAFQPKRAIVPSLPLKFVVPESIRTRDGRPRMPRDALPDAPRLALATIAESGICSIRPAPKMGVGMRKLDVAVALGLPEVLLDDVAERRVAARIDAAADHEERVHATVALTVAAVAEAHLAHGAVRPEERGNHVARAKSGGGRDLGILRRARPADCRLGMAAATALEVEARAEAFADAFVLAEGLPARLECRALGVGESRKRIAHTCRAAARAGIDGTRLSLRTRRHQEE